MHDDKRFARKEPPRFEQQEQLGTVYYVHIAVPRLAILFNIMLLTLSAISENSGHSQDQLILQLFYIVRSSISSCHTVILANTKLIRNKSKTLNAKFKNNTISYTHYFTLKK